LNRHAIVFGFVGKFIAKKRPMDFVNAIRLAARINEKIQGLMIGDGLLRTACEEYVRTHHIPIRFTGFLNQSAIPAGYVSIDALILPSDGSETWGLVVNEAMACGRPCIVSDRVGCGPDLIIPEQTGAIFPLGNLNALAHSMTEMAHLPRLALMGARSRTKIQNYSVPAAVDALVRCLESILKARRVHANAR
jgi:glycosyltransferase involved in cell wall biosynthesis